MTPSFVPVALALTALAAYAHGACSPPFNQVLNAVANTNTDVAEGSSVVWTCNSGFVATVNNQASLTVTAACTEGSLSPPVSACQPSTSGTCSDTVACPGLATCKSGKCACPAGTVAAYDGGSFVNCLSPQIVASDALLGIEAEDLRFTLADADGQSVSGSLVAVVSDIAMLKDKVANDVPSTISDSLDDAKAYADNVYGQALNFSTDLVASALTEAASTAQEKASTAKTEAIDEATTLAGTAKTEAIDEATTLASTAKTEAIDEATSLARTAKTEAIDEATTLAGTAKTEAIAEATSLAGTAKTEAIAEATSLAGTAKTEAIAEVTSVFGQLVRSHPALNGTMQALLDLVSGSVLVNEDAINSIKVRLTQLESGQLPKTCLDVLHNTVGSHTRRSQVYTLYPTGDVSKSVQRFCELHRTANPAEDINIALNKPADQSSVDIEATADRIVDGKLHTTGWKSGSCNHGLKETNAWWAVDLQKTTIVDRIVMAGRGDCCLERSNNFEIRLAPAAWPSHRHPAEYPECTPDQRHNPNQGGAPTLVECSNRIEARYVIFYLPGVERTLNFCELEVYEASLTNDDAGGWTLIASTDGSILPSELRTYYTDGAVEPGDNALIEEYFTKNIKNMGDELLIVNSEGDSHVFKLADFEGDLIFDGPNRVKASNSRHQGVIYGNNRPVLNHYQVGQVCDSADCDLEVATSGDTTYTQGMMIVFDWETSISDGNPNTSLHAQLGGTATMNGFSKPLLHMYIR